jgi:hypothetical protein
MKHFCAISTATMALLLGALTSSAGTHTWTGARNGWWSEPLNWSGGVPQTGEPPPVEIVIPASAPGHRDLTNDLAGITVDRLVVTAHANTLHASPGIVLRLRNAVVQGLGNDTILERSFHLGLEGFSRLQGSNSFLVRCPITEGVPGAALEVSGNASIEANCTHSGPTFFTDGSIVLLGAMTNSAFIRIATNATVTLAADVSVLTNLGTLHLAPESRARPETSRLYVQGLVCCPGSTTTVSMIDYPARDSTSPADGGRLHSHLVVAGPVVLAGRLEPATDLSQGGLQFTVIENTGTAPTMGQFDELPEGAMMLLGFGPLVARISYRGGDGNDVTLTLIEPPAGRRLAGPWQLENGWLQVLAGIGEFDALRPHRWEVSENLASPNGWTTLGLDFVPAANSTLLTLTNAKTQPQRFFRLAVP